MQIARLRQEALGRTLTNLRGKCSNETPAPRKQAVNDSPMKTHDWTEITKREEPSTVTKNHEKKMNPVQFFHRRE